MVFSVPEGPGQLFKALSVFALRELDISKIESRPMRSKPMQPYVGAGRATTPYHAIVVRRQTDSRTTAKHTSKLEQVQIVSSSPMLP